MAIASAESELFRGELALVLGWESGPVTIRSLADSVGATADRVRYHVREMERGGRVVVTRDAHGRLLVALPAPAVEYGTLIRCHDGRPVGPAGARHVERSRRAAARELRPRSGAPEPGLGVIVVGGFRCWIEPPFAAAAE